MPPRNVTRRPCISPGCPALRAKASYFCAAHKVIDNKRTQQAHGHKYGAVATAVDGIRFASKAEARRYAELKLQEKSGIISTLRLQTRWPLFVNGHLVGHYVSDFDYWCSPSFAHERFGVAEQTLVVEDVKGVKTPLYRFKKKCFEAQQGLTITEVK